MMKNAIWLLVCLAFAKAYTTQAQVFIDKVNAPLNPVGAYGVELAAMNLKGDVYIVDYWVYNRDGKRMVTASSYSLEEAIKNKWPFTELQNGLIIKDKSKYAVVPKTYQYNANKCIISEEDDYWIRNYRYDSKKRLIETTSYRKKEQTTDVTSYSYALINDILTVTSDFRKNKENPGILTEQFKNGLKISAKWNDEAPITREYEFDKKGNWITEKVVNPRYSTSYKNRNIVYYEDIDKIIKSKKLNWEKCIFVEGSDIVLPYVMVNNQPIKKRIMVTQSINNDGLFFIELDDDSRYYYSVGAYASNKDLGVKGIATEIAAGCEALLEYRDNSIGLYDKARALKNFKHHRYGSSYYVADSTGQRHFIIQNYESKNGFYPATVFEGKPVIYGQNPERNEFKLYADGESIENYDGVSWKYLDNGDYVVVKNDKPLYILTGSATNTNYKLYLGKPYNGEKLFDTSPIVKKKPNNKTTAGTTSPEPIATKPISTKANNTSLSQNAQKVINAQKSTDAKSKTKTILKEMDDALIAKGMSATLKVDMFATLFKELYPVDKEAAYQIAMHMPRSIDVLSFLALLTKEQKAFVKTRSRKIISSYKGATSN